MTSTKNDDPELSPDYLKYVRTRLNLCGPYGHPLVCQSHKPTNYNPRTDKINKLITEDNKKGITNKI